MSFVANTREQQAEMLATIGVAGIDELFADIPKQFQIGDLAIPTGLSESEVFAELRTISRRNADNLTSFLGGGFYDHFIPAAVDALSGRGEFFTAYTPYQPEASQGTLQAIFEYQSAINRLTRMEVTNASLYDGGTALFEAALMAIRVTDRTRLVIDAGVNPIYRRMLHTHTLNLGVELVVVPHNDIGQVDRAALKAAIDDTTAAVVLQNPNFLGTVDDFSDLTAHIHARGALLVMSVYPLALGLLKAPGDMGADIVTGEGQSLGLPLSFGGPWLGFMATRLQHVRKMPGRLAGETIDRQGRRSFVLTLQAREQHIRREKATSNVCTNQALCALRALIYLTLLGKQGLQEAALICAKKAAYAQQRLCAIPGVSLKYNAPFFNEFVLELPVAAATVTERLLQRGFAAGYPLDHYYEGATNSLLVAVTEKRSAAEIDGLAAALVEVL